MDPIIGGPSNTIEFATATKHTTVGTKVLTKIDSDSKQITIATRDQV